MNNPKELLQERLEQLEMGGSLEECLVGLSADEAELLRLAAGLRKVAYPEQSEGSAAAQRAAVLELAQERIMNEQVAREAQEVAPRRSWPRWLVPATVFSGAGALALVCMLAVAIAAGAVWWSGREAAVVEKPAPAAISAETPPGEGRHEFFLPLVSRVIPLTPERARVEDVRGFVEVQAEDNSAGISGSEPQLVFKETGIP